MQTNLALFKKSPDVNVLLMPIYAGSKGLNIVEATNVLLVEPMLNTGAELQAIGRVHRMGQTRYKFLYHLIIAEHSYTGCIDMCRHTRWGHIDCYSWLRFVSVQFLITP